MTRDVFASLQDSYPSTWRTLPPWSDIPDGWVGVVDRMSAALEPLVRDLPDWSIAQVKEKFAELRVYSYGGNDATDSVIAEAVSESRRTCQRCSAPGEARGNHWIWTLCDECEGKRIAAMDRRDK